ncbi:CoA transferase [Candidatus Skiveiella danica]|uniref:CoA transferase n=1 Tax=Candidatus Skiveiella danica TaxID=3386177 RepID=UPI001D2C2503|nr:CoA transferase [Betaproteobacteria bacterium]
MRTSRRAACLAGILALVDAADVLVVGVQAGVMERLDLGPEVLCERNHGWCTVV